MPKSKSNSSLHYVKVDELCFSWPNGQKVFNQLSFTLSPGQTYSLIGPNGAGKTTLSKLLCGELQATSGQIIVSGSCHYFAQYESRTDSQYKEHQSLATYLMPLWESQLADPKIYSPLLKGIDLELPLQSLSGGEWTRARLALVLALGPELLILDEPTNNLDFENQKFVSDFIKNYQGTLLVISHDRKLLNEIPQTLELSPHGVQVYGGNYDFYLEQSQQEEDLKYYRLEKTKKDLKKKKLENQKKEESQQKRMKAGQAKADKGGIPKIFAGTLKRKAENTLAKVKTQNSVQREKLQSDIQSIYFSLKETESLNLKSIVAQEKMNLKKRQLVLLKNANFCFQNQSKDFWKENISFYLNTGDRLALIGKNGSGKTSLIENLLKFSSATNSQLKSQPPSNKKEIISKDQCLLSGEWSLMDLHYAYLDQNYSLIENNKSVLDNANCNEKKSLKEIRNALAHFQFTGEKVFQMAKTLSYGEKLKLSLAKVFLSENFPDLIILDEPTNNLDINSLEVLEKVLNDYPGGLIVISHDNYFLKNINITKKIYL